MATGSDERIVAGKYRMGETLGKGGYSWVKKGTNVNTGEEVALKFTHRHGRWDAQDQGTIDTELEALAKLTKAEHPNVMRIIEHNTKCPYPTKDGKDLSTILFVLEFAAGGELFDILYYTGKLDDDLARTYMHQLINGLEALHRLGICHRDIKPQNLLLDDGMTLKITDFGLSKIMNSDEDTVMTTTHVGTRGFQSPEQRLNQPYTVAADLFAAGVVLFILSAGYPPFEHAQQTDYWYKDLMEKPGKPAKPVKFWKKHREAGLSEDLQDFINNLLASDPHKRFTIDQIREHRWFQGRKLTQEELKEQLTSRLATVQRERLNDVEKKMEQMDSIKKRAGVKKVYDEARVAPDYRTSTFRGMTKFHTKAHPDAIRDAIKEFIEAIGHADISTDYHVKALVATKNQKLEFEANIYNDAQAEENVVTIKRLQGGFVEYGKFYNMLLNDALYPLNVEA